MPAPIVAAIGAGLAGSAMQASAAKKAAGAQERAAADQIAYQEETRDLIMERMDPFYKSGLSGQDAYLYELGMGDTPEDYAGFTGTPGYQFQMDQGLGAVNALAGARGGLDSGRTRQDLMRFGSGLAAQEYGTHLNRLAGLTDQGMSAAGMQAGAATNAAAGVSNALANRGNAQAAGYIGQANAWGQGIGNTMGLLNYQNSLAGGNANILSTPWAAPGFW